MIQLSPQYKTHGDNRYELPDNFMASFFVYGLAHSRDNDNLFGYYSIFNTDLVEYPVNFLTMSIDCLFVYMFAFWGVGLYICLFFG